MRSKTVHLKLTEEEHQALKMSAFASNTTIQNYAVSQLTGSIQNTRSFTSPLCKKCGSPLIDGKCLQKH